MLVTWAPCSLVETLWVITMGDAPQRGSAQVTSGAQAPPNIYPIEPRLQQTEGLWPRLHMKTLYLLHSHARCKQQGTN